MEFNVAEVVRNIALFFPIFLFSLSFHEYAHGWMAHRKGDNTAEQMGRLNMNPWTHADPIGTILLPLVGIASSFVMIGWGKPVPVNPRNLNKPKEDMFWIALAGPLSNMFLFAVGVILYIVYGYMNPSETFTMALTTGGKHLGNLPTVLDITFKFLSLNLVLALFNLIPVHPLDGGKVLARFLPYKTNLFLEQNQGPLFIGLMLFLMFGFNFLAGPVGYTLLTVISAADYLILS